MNDSLSIRRTLIISVLSLTLSVMFAASLDAAPAVRQPVLRIDVGQTAEPISPYIYGQFIEHLAHSSPADETESGAVGTGSGDGTGGTLIFRTGFERESIGKPAHCHTDIVGVDRSVEAPNDWQRHLEAHPMIGRFGIQFSNGNSGDRYARIVDDPTGAGQGRVLKYWMKNALRPSAPGRFKGRIQVNMAKGSPKFDEMTSSMKIFLHPNFRVLEQRDKRLPWLTLKEYWTNPVWGKNIPHFRITLDVHKKAGIGERLYWHLGSTRTVRHIRYWQADTHDQGIRVPIGEWFTLAVYYKQGDATSGRFRVRITYADGTERELFDVTNWTMSPDNPDEQTGMAFWNPMKLYASEKTFSYIRDKAGPATVYWDDWKLYRGDAYSNSR